MNAQQLRHRRGCQNTRQACVGVCQSDIWRVIELLQSLLQIFKAVPYCVDLIDGPYIETTEAVVKAFRPPAEIRKERPR